MVLMRNKIPFVGLIISREVAKSQRRVSVYAPFREATQKSLASLRLCEKEDVFVGLVIARQVAKSLRKSYREIKIMMITIICTMNYLRYMYK